MGHFLSSLQMATKRMWQTHLDTQECAQPETIWIRSQYPTWKYFKLGITRKFIRKQVHNIHLVAYPTLFLQEALYYSARHTQFYLLHSVRKGPGNYINLCLIIIILLICNLLCAMNSWDRSYFFCSISFPLPRNFIHTSTLTSEIPPHKVVQKTVSIGQKYGM